MSSLKQEKDLNSIFAALADKTRRDILLSLAKEETAINQLSKKYSMSLTGLRKHIRVLEDAGVVDVRKDGRTQICKLKPKKFTLIVNQIKIYESFWKSQLDSFAKQIEE